MNYQLLDQYKTINRKRLEPTAKNSGKAEAMSRFQNIISQLREIEKNSTQYLSKWNVENEDMHFRGISPIFLTFIALCMMAFPIYMYFVEGQVLGGNEMAFGLWILPGLAIALRVWLGEGFDTPVWHWVFHILWFVFCVVRGGIGKVTFFGSEMAWLWGYYLGELVIVLILRLLEGIKTVWPAARKYKKEQQSVEKGEQLLKEASSLYMKVSEGQSTELQNWLKLHDVNWKPEERKPWFIFPRTFDENYRLIVPGRHVDTTFKESFKEEEWTREDNDFTWHFKRTIHVNDFGYRDVSAGEIRQLLGEKKLYPFYGLGLPEVSEEFRYSLFRHRWDYTEVSTQREHYSTVEERDSQAQLRFDREKKIDELWELGSTAENYVALTGHEMAAKEKYLKKKEEKRKAIGSEKYIQRHNDVHSYKKQSSGDEIASVLVYSSSNKLIGVYCADSLEAVLFTADEVKNKMNFQFSPALTAFGEAQKGVLYTKYLM